MTNMENNATTKESKRFLARIIIEAQTPLFIGSGEKDILTDALVSKDANGMPYIPGTSIAGVIRHSLEENPDSKVSIDRLFGLQDKNDSFGSRIIFSEARMIGENGKVLDGLLSIPETSFYDKYLHLPIRQHVRISHKGASEKGGKFDQEAVYKGTRFCFEIEIVADDLVEQEKFNLILNRLMDDSIRFGGKSRSGFGQVKIVSCQTRTLDLDKKEDLQAYLEKSSSLDSNFKWEDHEITTHNGESKEYKLTLKPVDFFLFGSGFGDEEADMTTAKENIVIWEGGKASFAEQYLIPGSSIKGAIAHRTAYNYNKIKKIFADNEQLYPDDVTGDNNVAVKQLFGDAEETRGNVIFSDIFIDGCKDKIINHVSIDRFTGGAIDGALFAEKDAYGKGITLSTTIYAKTKNDDEDIEKAFVQTLKDLCDGFLPLGGGINRGNGLFYGQISGAMDYTSKNY
jgi:CRISPR/Cas system CSM-associated protein Csm3 (group 7 of RAMP superfamily)